MRVFVFILMTAMSQLLFAQDQVIPAKSTAYWIKNQKINFMFSQPDSETFAPVHLEGTNWLFEYRFTGEDRVQVSDDEMQEVICFAIPPQKGSSFRISDSRLINYRTYYMLGCFCSNRGFYVVKNGNISGKKLNSTTWQISIDITVQTPAGEIKKKVSKKFVLLKNGK